MPLAADYPLLEIFSTIAFVALWALWLWLVISTLLDNFRREDNGGVAKAVWTVLVILVPIIGIAAYWIARPSPAAVEAYNTDSPRPTWRR